MTYRFQYQQKAEPLFTGEVPLDRWFQPISNPVRLTAAVLSLAAIASTTMAIESKIPLPPGETPEILDWMVQHPDPVREPESAVVTQHFAYASYCFTNVPAAGARKFPFASQSGDFIATFSVTPNGDSLQESPIWITNDPDPIGASIDNAIELRFNSSPSNTILVNGSAPDQVFPWVVGTTHEVEVRVNLTLNTCTVIVDGTVIATDFAFQSGDLTPASLDHWGFGNDGFDTVEICDFRAVTDNSAFEIVPTYTQSQPLPFPPERPVDEGGVFHIPEPSDLIEPQLEWLPIYPDILPVVPHVTQIQAVPFQLEETAIVTALDRWFLQRPEQILVPPRPVDEGHFTIDAELLTAAETIFLDKWFQPLSEPIFLPVRMEHLSPALARPPLGALPLAGKVTDTVTTMLSTFVGVKGTKFKIQIRQTGGSPVLETVQQRSVLRVAFHPRSILLANNTLVQQTGSYDASITGQAQSQPQIFDFLRARESGAGGNNNDHICLEFNVSAFEGVIYRSVKLRLTNEEDNDLFTSVFRCARIIRPWRLDIGEVSYDEYDRILGLAWDNDGGRGALDRAEVVDWVNPGFPNPQAVNTTTESPDLTLLVEQAIKLDGGILKLMVQKKNNTSQGSNINDFHSSRAPGISASQKPHLFFDAF